MRKNNLTSLHNINFSDVLELPDGDIQRAESSSPTNASTAVDHYGRSQLMPSPGRDHLRHHLGLFLPDTLQHRASSLHTLPRNTYFALNLIEIVILIQNMLNITQTNYPR